MNYHSRVKFTNTSSPAWNTQLSITSRSNVPIIKKTVKAALKQQKTKYASSIAKQ